MYNIAVILAGGTGTRAGAGQPKQFRLLPNGRTVLETCVTAFEANRHIDEIAIVMLREFLPQVRELTSVNSWHKVKYLIEGGAERWQSSWNAIETIYDKVKSIDCNVLLHDAARPFVSQDIINDVCHELESHEAVSVAVPMTDTVYEVDICTPAVIKNIPKRDSLCRAQTPQAFRLPLIYNAYCHMLASEDNSFTDDCGVIQAFNPDVSIYLIKGDESNRKLTYKEDFV